jgi:hypothetical protein
MDGKILFARWLRLSQQPNQFIFPQSCQRVAPVTARLFAQGQDHGAPVRHAFDFALEDSQFRRIDQVVGSVDGD